MLYVVGAVSSAILAVGHPVSRSLLPLLLPDDLRPAAFALQSTNVRLGVMVGGGLISVPFAIVSGGLACVAAAAGFALFVPRLAHYEPSAATVAEP